jgi:CRISPR-associated endonuclease/helicase Cas3
MIVTFVSECDKKAINKTCRVLDAFANRLGNRTWQTVITNEGLQSVKKLLRATASKNTAVACHWIRSRSRSELLWIVGDRKKFNNEGFVPVNTTKKDILKSHWENGWRFLPLIKSLTALAALFHDWGKSTDYFQEKLINLKKTADPLRHEWLSILLLNVLVNNATDEEWLKKLSTGQISSNALISKLIEKYNNNQLKTPLNQLPEAASIIAWLIVSHHRLPVTDQCKGMELQDFKSLFNMIYQTWGYENKSDETQFKKDLKHCLCFSKGLPIDSSVWLKFAQKYANKMIDSLPLLRQTLADGSWRIVLHYSRLALMLGDHWHSSQDKDDQWKCSCALYANTDSKSNSLKQQLDEHLIGVTRQALKIAHLLPAFENRNEELLCAYDVKPLQHKSPAKYNWQDAAVSKIKAWRQQQGDQMDPYQFGFFAVNMASTGTGKTFANAKIMRALSMDEECLRYILALGLRTLTLQTGDEYRNRIKLDKDELAVIIGSRAILDLHNNNFLSNTDDRSINNGSESEESLLDNDIYFEAAIPESNLSTVLRSDKNRQLLYAPVLCCTIDHLIAATETKKGGKYILPFLRLMSSDLVIDEIDDFDGKDLIVIGRLIHLAGMLGRKVMISSATIPPNLAEGYYNAYQAGWSLFAKSRGLNQNIGCVWIDEFKTVVNTINSNKEKLGVEEFRQYHKLFVEKRCEYLQKQSPKRKVNIIPCNLPDSITEKQSIESYYFSVIKEAIIEKHLNHHLNDTQTGKNVSFGLVRIANIIPCINLTRYLLNTEFPDDIDIRVMAYHSRQVLIMRNEQEKYLDDVLKRNKGDHHPLSHPHIRSHLEEISSKNVIFILVASPVEEVGRDHDFDWAIVEPSSYRSFIQLVGRVLRHREPPKNGLSSPNIALLQYNIKGLLSGKSVAFTNPGYESNTNRLSTHDLFKLVDVEKLSERLDAQPRINKKGILNPQSDLADLEHTCIHQLLTDYSKKGPESIEGWLSGFWWLTAIPQILIKFRGFNQEKLLYLVPDDQGWVFAEKDPLGNANPVEICYNIKQEDLTKNELERLWLKRDYETLLEKTQMDKEKAALIYGEIGLPIYGNNLNDLNFTYINQLGLTQKIKRRIDVRPCY